MAIRTAATCTMAMVDETATGTTMTMIAIIAPRVGLDGDDTEATTLKFEDDRNMCVVY